ncbi:wax ester/triacylglycerol synthase family O-acyltransferase, partial [Mycobacterium sp. ITM-2017-0098]
DAATPEPVEGPGDAAPWEIAADGLWRFVTLPWQLTKSVPATARLTVLAIMDAVAGEAMAAPFSAPTTRFNGRLTSERSVAVVSMNLQDVKKVK